MKSGPGGLTFGSAALDAFPRRVGVPELITSSPIPSSSSGSPSAPPRTGPAAPVADPSGPESLPLAAPRDPAGLLALVRDALDDLKAEEMVEIDLDGRSSLADAMVIASGRSQRHVASLADNVVKALAAAGLKGLRVEGLPQADWVLIDVGDVLVHVFRPEVRTFYNLEKLWGSDRPDERRSGTVASLDEQRGAA